MVVFDQPQWPAGCSFESQQWGCVAACLQTLAGFPLQPFTPAHSEFARLDTCLGAGENLPITIRALSQTHASLPTRWERRRPSPCYWCACMCPLPKMTQVSSLAIALPRTPAQPVQHSEGWTKQQCYSCKSETDNREESSALTPTAIGCSGYK